jgi:hypothetical protein
VDTCQVLFIIVERSGVRIRGLGERGMDQKLFHDWHSAPRRNDILLSTYSSLSSLADAAADKVLICC